MLSVRGYNHHSEYQLKTIIAGMWMQYGCCAYIVWCEEMSKCESKFTMKEWSIRLVNPHMNLLKHTPSHPSCSHNCRLMSTDSGKLYIDSNTLCIYSKITMPHNDV